MPTATKATKRSVTEVAPTVRREHRFDKDRGCASTFLIASCRTCKGEFTYRVGHAKNTREGSDERMMAQRMRLNGWDVTNDLRKPECPTCIEARKPPAGARVLEAVPVTTDGPSPPVGIVRHIAGAKHFVAEQEISMPQEATAMRGPGPVLVEPPKADAPPKPSPSQRRSIVDALDEAYDTTALGYRAPHTDATVAKRLDMPRQWIVEVRELVFGPALSPSKLREQLDSVMRRVDSVETTVLKATEQLDALRKEAQAIADVLARAAA